jgi:hypothetical protein
MRSERLVEPVDWTFTSCVRRVANAVRFPTTVVRRAAGVAGRGATVVDTVRSTSRSAAKRSASDVVADRAS